MRCFVIGSWHGIILALGKWREEDREFKVITNYIVSLSPACPMWDPISKKEKGKEINIWLIDRIEQKVQKVDKKFWRLKQLEKDSSHGYSGGLVGFS